MTTISFTCHKCNSKCDGNIIPVTGKPKDIIEFLSDNKIYNSCKNCNFLNCKNCLTECKNCPSTFCLDCINNHNTTVQKCFVCKKDNCNSIKCNDCDEFYCTKCYKPHTEICKLCKKRVCFFKKCKYCKQLICSKCIFDTNHYISCVDCSKASCIIDKGKSSKEWITKCDTCDNYSCCECHHRCSCLCCNIMGRYGENPVTMCKKCINKDHVKFCPLCNKARICHRHNEDIVEYNVYRNNNRNRNIGEIYSNNFRKCPHNSKSCILCNAQLHIFPNTLRCISCPVCLDYQASYPEEFDGVDMHYYVDPNDGKQININLCCQHENLTIPEIFERNPKELSQYKLCVVCQTVTCLNHAKQCEKCCNYLCKNEDNLNCKFCSKIEECLNTFLLKDLINIVFSFLAN